MSGEALASQPTFSRLENAVDRHAVEALAATLVDVYVRERGPGRHRRRSLLLDLDGTDNPAHGEQEGVRVPRLLPGSTCTIRSWSSTARPASSSRRSCGPATPTPVASSSWCFRRLLRRFRAAWPDGHAEESGPIAALPCRVSIDGARLNAVTCTIGLIPNPTLERLAAPLLAQARAQSAEQGGVKVRLAGEDRYQAKSWPHARRVVFKAEVLTKGPNTRFVVTTRDDEPLALYDFYVDRGDAGTASKTSRTPWLATASPTTASGPTPSDCCCTLLPSGSSTPSDAGLPQDRGRRLPVRHPPPPSPQDRRARPRTRRLRPPLPHLQPSRRTSLVRPCQRLSSLRE